MEPSTLMYIIGGIVALLTAVIGYAEVNTRRNWSRVFTDLDSIKNTQINLTKDVGFLQGKVTEHAERLERITEKNIENERRFSILETKIAK